MSGCMNNRGSMWIDGERIDGIRVYRVHSSGREALVSLRRLMTVETFEDAPDFADVDWCGTTYEAEKIDIEDDQLVYRFDLETERDEY